MMKIVGASHKKCVCRPIRRNNKEQTENTMSTDPSTLHTFPGYDPKVCTSTNPSHPEKGGVLTKFFVGF